MAIDISVPAEFAGPIDPGADATQRLAALRADVNPLTGDAIRYKWDMAAGAGAHSEFLPDDPAELAGEGVQPEPAPNKRGLTL
jgi:hypothetical protein